MIIKAMLLIATALGAMLVSNLSINIANTGQVFTPWPTTFVILVGLVCTLLVEE